MQQVKQSITEGLVYEFDEFYDKIEDRRKKAVAAKLGTVKVRLKYITIQKKASEQRQKGYQTVIMRRAHYERDEEDELDDKKAFVTSSYHELQLKKEEE